MSFATALVAFSRSSLLTQPRNPHYPAAWVGVGAGKGTAPRLGVGTPGQG
jgi:hypothetical protein